jgi:hypothetical protein
MLAWVAPGVMLVVDGPLDASERINAGRLEQEAVFKMITRVQ